MTRYIYATNRSWTLDAFARRRGELEGDWLVVTSPEDLKAALVVSTPRYVFFPHWSHIVPKSVLDSVECVCFHMTDVPYGRGGSPLQNLIERGHTETRLTALRMSEELDAGPVYLKVPMSLDGSATVIFERMADLAIDLMAQIVRDEPQPVPQAGPVGETFTRRTAEQSVLPSKGSLETINDHIRMLDAEGYPHAYLEHGDFRLVFRDSNVCDDGTVQAQVRFVRQRQENGS